MLTERKRPGAKHLKRGKNITLIVVLIGFAIMLVLGIYMIRYLENMEVEQQEQVQDTVQVEG